ncbi:lipocalin family protein [Psychrobacter sp. FBL11]|uniref:Lipocalin family protein n=1 Tax=Psychrobacter saeujeotis TaxID=3143436 RepID=A0ABU9X5H4_9GAMM|nr:lipocalin family protein [uncultured Psychrobacter sp.]
MKTNKLPTSEYSDIQAAGSQSGQNHQLVNKRLIDDVNTANNYSNASNDANYNKSIHLLSGSEKSINNDLTSTGLNDEVPERIFMNSLIKHTGIALAIIVPLAAFSAYAATPPEMPASHDVTSVSTGKVDAKTATNNTIDITPSSIIHQSATEPTTVDSLDLTKYSGTWYEIGRLPMYFQRNCASDVTATYTPNAKDTGITVLNQCIDEDGESVTAEGLAKPADDTGSKLKVTFLPSWIRWLPVGRADYWVLAHDPNYKTALVGTPDKEYLWLLARSPNISQEAYAKYRQIAQQQGYDLKAFTLTDHRNQTVNLVP